MIDPSDVRVSAHARRRFRSRVRRLGVRVTDDAAVDRAIREAAVDGRRVCGAGGDDVQVEHGELVLVLARRRELWVVKTVLTRAMRDERLRQGQQRKRARNGRTNSRTRRRR
ncbi:MAG: hypothetical protein AAFZ07_20340 [Actinomycetota bacterium]